jgi:hypothetical protein
VWPVRCHQQAQRVPTVHMHLFGHMRRQDIHCAQGENQSEEHMNTCFGQGQQGTKSVPCRHHMLALSDRLSTVQFVPFCLSHI